MKKLLSVVMAVAMMATAVFSITAMSAYAEDTDLLTLCPDGASWTVKDGGEGTVTVAKEGNAFVFTATKGWPSACCNFTAPVTAKMADNYLNYDFTAEASANVIVFFNNEDPAAASDGTPNHITLNPIIDPTTASTDPSKPDAVGDLKAGTYKGSIKLSDLSKAAVDGADSLVFTGLKVFAVGGKVTVNAMTVSGAAAGPTVTTAATTAGAGATTTKAAATTASNAKTGWEDNIALYAVVALGAAAVVTVSVVAGKKAKSK